MKEEATVQKDFLGLRTKREALGLTLKDVFALTRVSVVNLEAIETGNFALLPVPLYARNFIKTYARVLEMDSKPILDSYEEYLKALKTSVSQVPEDDGEKSKPVGGKRFRKICITAVVIVVVIAVAVFVLIDFYQKRSGVTESKGLTPATVSAVPADAAATSQPESVKEAGGPANTETGQTMQSTGTLQQKSASQSKPVIKQSVPEAERTKPRAVAEEAELLVIKSLETTWLRMKIDQNQPYEVLLQPGETIERRGVDFEIDIGNAGGVKMQFKGKTFEKLGKSGQVIHLRLP